jgi:hypothetical protein
VRPLEELYDLTSDPHQVKNLATDPKHRSELLRHRKLLDEWSIRTDDKGMYQESAEQLRATYDLWMGKEYFRKLELNPEYKAFR